MEAAIACDVIVAGKSAVFGSRKSNWVSSAYAAIRLPHLVGPGKAIEICTTGNATPLKTRKIWVITHCVEDAGWRKPWRPGQGNPVQQPLIIG